LDSQHTSKAAERLSRLTIPILRGICSSEVFYKLLSRCVAFGAMMQKWVPVTRYTLRRSAVSIN